MCLVNCVTKKVAVCNIRGLRLQLVRKLIPSQKKIGGNIHLVTLGLV